MVDLDTRYLRGRSPDGGPARDPFGLIGQVLDEQFRVESVLGEGGFSVVYRGTHLGLSEPIAIKCLKLPVALGSAAVESFVQRFRDEGRILYKLSQGNLHIVRSIASGMTMGPLTGALIPYTVLEWLDGYSLASELEARRQAGLQGRTLAEAIPLLDSAVLAVVYAHTQGVVHRDLNPGNIFFAKTREGVRAKVLDFGLAKVVSDHAIELGPRAETLSHIQIFAPAYAAPEQMDKRLGPVGAWTDVYTLALVLLEVMADRSIITGEHLGEIMAKTLGLHRPTPRNVGLTVSDEVEALFASALELDPTKRPRDAGVFWGALKNCVSKENPPRAAVKPLAVSPMDAFRSLPLPGAAGGPTSTAGGAAGTPSGAPAGALSGKGALNQTMPMSSARPSGQPSSGPSSAQGAFPRMASTMPLGDAIAEAKRRAFGPKEASIGGVALPPNDTPALSRGPSDRPTVEIPAPASQTSRNGRLLVLGIAALIAILGAAFVLSGFLSR